MAASAEGKVYIGAIRSYGESLDGLFQHDRQVVGMGFHGVYGWLEGLVTGDKPYFLAILSK